MMSLKLAHNRLSRIDIESNGKVVAIELYIMYRLFCMKNMTWLMMKEQHPCCFFCVVMVQFFYMQCNEANPFNFHMHHTKPSYADLFHISLLLTVAVECE